MVYSDTIRALGGAKSLADALRSRGVAIADVTVRSWTLKGRIIPAKYWQHIAQIAETKGQPISFEELAAAAARPSDERSVA